MITDPTANAFRRKILSFCDIRLAPLVAEDELKRLKRYMLGLIDDRTPPPSKGKEVDWEEIALSCRLEKPATKLRRIGQHGFDAIVRWLGSHEQTTGNVSQLSRGKQKSCSEVAPNRPRQKAAGSKTKVSAKGRARPGPKPQPIDEFPEPLFETYQEPVSFQAALKLHLDRFGETYHQLHRAVVRVDDGLAVRTLLSWLKGTKVPRSVESMEILNRIERRYRLPAGDLDLRVLPRPRSRDQNPGIRHRRGWARAEPAGIQCRRRDRPAYRPRHHPHRHELLAQDIGLPAPCLHSQRPHDDCRLDPRRIPAHRLLRLLIPERGSVGISAIIPAKGKRSCLD